MLDKAPAISCTETIEIVVTPAKRNANSRALLFEARLPIACSAPHVSRFWTRRVY
jgi:hypothetical protein